MHCGRSDQIYQEESAKRQTENVNQKQIREPARTNQIPGLLGTYYSFRHENGLYRSCAVTSSYTFTPTAAHSTISHPVDEFTAHLSRGLSRTIERHPSLCYGLLGASKPCHLPARFKRLSQIAWDDVVEIVFEEKSDGACVQERETRVCAEIGSAHERLFDDQHHKPAWRVRVLMYGAQDGTCRVYILFLANHAIADGLSCAAFQRTLHEQLCLATVETPQTSGDVQWPYIIPETVGKPIAIEDAIDISPPGCESLDLQGPSNEKKEKIWAGNFPCMPTIAAYKSLILLITIFPAPAQRVLETSRRLKITVTGYLHGLIVSYLARATVTDNQLGLKGGTPYSLRRCSKLPLGEMANHISSITTHWDAALVNRMRHVKEESFEEEELIAAIGNQLSAELSTELKGIQDRGVSLLRFVQDIVDLDTFCREKLSEERSETYEISNLGVVKMNQVPEESSSTLRLDGLIFSQCGSVHGSPIGCNVANLEGGPLVISLTWQKGGVDDEIMEGLQNFLKSRLGA
ncbi:hypothetical protein NHQ30_010766 [Ciborinia camelliae]|nr:hypothetical protein NHQ30_010766 [Ciborinia camelliae]